MIRLLRRPFGSHGKVHEITPSSAGWRHVGFSLWRLRVGETVSDATGDREVILIASASALERVCRLSRSSSPRAAMLVNTPIWV
jgi:5-deoxy-D-glucuronate isomerase